MRKSQTYFILFNLLYFLSDCSEKLTIGIIGDQFGAINSDSSFAVLEEAIIKVNSNKPDITLHVGDLVESIQNVNSYEDYQKYFGHAINIMNRLECPWLMAIGDHDVVPPLYEPLSDDRSRENWYLEQSNINKLKNNGKLYYSYDLKGYHFVVLYSLENLHTDPRWGSIFLNQVSEDQIKWLQNDLDEHINANGIIVLVHYPHWYVWQNWSKVHDILRKYPVIAVIAGHYHYDQDDGELDGIRYFTMGSTGGVIKYLDENSGGCYEYAILTLQKNTIQNLQIYNALTGDEIEITPRQTMDRIQAIACMLGNLYQDESIYRGNGFLQSPDNSGKMRRIDAIGLESLCNPIDLPIQIKINDDKNLLSKPEWIGSQVSGDSLLTLQPGERTGWANYASVGQWFKPRALWTAQINPDNVLNSGKININVCVTFTDTRERIIQDIITYSVKENK